jgi:KTSC domain
MGAGGMNNAKRLLLALDAKLNGAVELTLYGRAALALGFEGSPEEFAASKDIDAIFWIGQAEELLEKTNFWEAIEEVNEEFKEDGLYITHLFEEDQVVLSPDWRKYRVLIPGPWKKLTIYRLGDGDLFLSKLMRNDPQDRADARFIAERSQWEGETVDALISSSRVPPAADVRAEFAASAAHFMSQVKMNRERVPLESAAVAAVAYDRTKNTLDVEFRGGGTYRYLQVPLAVYRSLLKAESAGAFWNEVKQDFAYVRLD